MKSINLVEESQKSILRFVTDLLNLAEMNIFVAKASTFTCWYQPGELLEVAERRLKGFAERLLFAFRAELPALCY